MMIRQVMQAIGSAAEKLGQRRGIVATSFVLYLVWIGVLYLFIATRDASVLQLLRTFVLGLIAIAIFFILQFVGVSYVREGGDIKTMARRAIAGWWKLLVISLPFLLLAWLIDAGFDKLHSRRLDHQHLSLALRWTRNLLIYLVLPLAAIHLWIMAEQGRLKAGLRRVWRALAPRFLLVYALIVAVFGSLAYAIAVTRTPAGNAWLEIGLFSARLVVVAVVIFSGWLLTLGALSELNLKSPD
jgi:hypothetical protein